MSDLDPGVRQDGAHASERPPSEPAPSDRAPDGSAPDGSAPGGAATIESGPPIDLDAIERDLRDVETSLARLADGTYFTQPGAPVPGTSAPGSAVDPTVDTSADADRDEAVEV